MNESNYSNPPLNSLAQQAYLLEHLNVPDGTTPSECVYHYTTADILEKFLSDEGDLLCTHCRALNDGGEFIVGVDQFIAYMNNRNWNRELIARVTERIRGFTKYDLAMPWIFSFSLYNDSLFQWSNYTDRQDGGYAIGIPIKRLSDLESRRMDKANKCNRYPVSTFFMQCIYVGLDDVFGMFDYFFRNYMDYNLVYSLRVDDGLVNLVMNMALVAASGIKDKSFYFEGEWRLVMSANFDEAYKRVKSIGGRARMPVCVKDDVGLLRDMISSVIISPHGRRDSLYINALNLKRKHDANFNIVFSASSYRG